MSVSVELVDPKSSLREWRVDDGQAVNILLPFVFVISDGKTAQEICSSIRLESK